MKKIIILLCWVLTAFCAVFPFIYFHSEQDKKEIKISHILVSSEEQAKMIQNEITEGKSFEDAAQEYSLCESKADKGDIGYNMRKHLLPEVENLAFNIEKNIVSNPIQSSEGWHLIKVYDIKYYSDKDSFIQKKIRKSFFK